ncbi:MAG: DUF5684 domain-containing protein [Candidatus Peribacteria bacterium]|nr:DUF5684 domain-containing protein [Candidatus Peribacteria bacterium]
MLVGVALAVLLIVAYWKVLVKAGYPGWGSFIPVYNVYLMFKLAGRPANWTWWILFPPVLAVLGIIAQFDIAKRF